MAMGMTVSFNRPDGKTASGYLAEPAHPAGAPAIVVIQEWWGVNEQIRGVADRLGLAGYAALVPDLYRGKATVEAEEAHHLMTGLNFGDAASQDIRGAVQYLKARGIKVGRDRLLHGGRPDAAQRLHGPGDRCGGRLVRLPSARVHRRGQDQGAAAGALGHAG